MFKRTTKLFFVVNAFFLTIANKAMAFSLVDRLNPVCREGGDCSVCDMLTILYQVAKFVFMSMSGIALILILWAGIGLIFNWGSAESVAQNKKIILHTLLAIVIILLAWTLVNALAVGFLGWKNVNWWKGPSC